MNWKLCKLNFPPFRFGCLDCLNWLRIWISRWLVIRRQPLPLLLHLSASPSTEDTGAGGYTRRERESAAKETGEFFVRCLSGEPRGSSGRGRIRLQNRIYVVVRSFAGEVFASPVVVLTSYAQVKQLVCHPRAESFGDSIFAGFPSGWEAQLAVATAGYTWP